MAIDFRLFSEEVIIFKSQALNWARCMGFMVVRSDRLFNDIMLHLSMHETLHPPFKPLKPHFHIQMHVVRSIDIRDVAILLLTAVNVTEM